MSINSAANQHTNDPREQVCWDFYVESITAGQENALQSALKAGYSEDHARNITLQGWFKERLARLKRKDMLSKAEKVLDEMLDMDPDGPIEKKIKQDTAKFLAERLGKNEGYSTKTETELSGAMEINTLSPEKKEKLDKILNAE